MIKSLEKDIYGLKKEIQERDETIQDKVGWRFFVYSCKECIEELTDRLIHGLSIWPAKWHTDTLIYQPIDPSIDW